MKEMKSNIKTLCMLVPMAAALLLTATGCKKDMTTFNVLAIMEDAPSDGSKTHLVEESHVYWDNGDKINVWYMGTDGTTPGNKGTAVFSIGSSSDDNTKAIFDLSGSTEKVEAPENLKGIYLALFPASGYNSVSGGNVTIYFPAEQGYFNDNSFGKAACPMVAYEDYKPTGDGDGGGLVRMPFHNLAGLARIQIIDVVNTEGDESTTPVHNITGLTFTTTSASPCKQLSGAFGVTNYDKNAPGLTAQATSNNTVTITPTSAIPLPVHNDHAVGNKEPLTFYLVLPAINGTGDNNYEITMTAKATDATTKATVQVQKTFRVAIRRNGITKVPALGITKWSESGDGDVSVGLAGNGTETRPFLIYSYEELVKLRDACNNNTKINGTSITNGVHIRIMRGDIVLGRYQVTVNGQTQWKENPWTVGIKDFRGTLTYGASQASAQQGITNNTNVPLFESIGTTTATGKVIGLTVNGSTKWGSSSLDAKTFSPLCRTNYGTIKNCMVGGDAQYVYAYTGTSQTVGMGGICAENYGTIEGCGCRGHLVAPKVGGICMNNHTGGKIERCFIPSPMRANVGTDETDSAGGICYSNQGEITDCYFAANINLSTTRWGGIVYENNGGTVTHCYVDASGIIQSKNSVGGLVHTMAGGTVDNCWNDADLLLVENYEGLGGLVYRMTGGTVRNSYRRRPTGSMTCKMGTMGGFVAMMSGGVVANCYVYSDMSQTVCSTKGIFVGNITGGTIENCYGEQTAALGSDMPFYGSRSGSPTLDDCFGKVGQMGVNTYTAYTGTGSLLAGLQGHTTWTADNGATHFGWEAGGTNEPPKFANAKKHR